jgi:hypothetical protein
LLGQRYHLLAVGVVVRLRYAPKLMELPPGLMTFVPCDDD